jgi:hypothetical protein
MADLFVSYAREDREGATAIVEALTEAGWSVFYDEHLPAGSHWILELEREIRAARCLVILLSVAAKDSRWIHEERVFAEENGLTVFPVRLDSSPLPLGFATRQTVSLPDWNGDTKSPAFLEIVKKLERQCAPSNRPAVAVAPAPPTTPPSATSPAPPSAPPPEASPTPLPSAETETNPPPSVDVPNDPGPHSAARDEDRPRSPWWLRVLRIVGAGLLNAFLVLLVFSFFANIAGELSRPSEEVVSRLIAWPLMAIITSVWAVRRITRSLVRLVRFVSPVQRAYYRAEALRAEERWNEAFEAYTKVLDRAPDHANAFAGRSLVSSTRPDGGAFEDDFDRARELGTTRHEFYEIEAASAAEGSGDHRKAIELYALAKRACEPRWWQPPEPGWSAAYVHYCSAKAECHIELSQYDEALKELSEAIGHSSEDGQLYRRRSFVHVLLGDNLAAAQDNEQATKLGRPRPSPSGRYMRRYG